MNASKIVQLLSGVWMGELKPYIATYIKSLFFED